MVWYTATLVQPRCLEQMRQPMMTNTTPTIVAQKIFR